MLSARSKIRDKIKNNINELTAILNQNPILKNFNVKQVNQKAFK